WMEWMERNPHQVHAIFEQGNPHVVRLLSNLVLAVKRSVIVSSPYINWNEESTPEGAQTPAGWPEGHNSSSTLPQPGDNKSPSNSPTPTPAINLGKSLSSESLTDSELPSQTLEPPPLQHQTTLQKSRSGRVTQPALPYWIVNNIVFKQSKFDITMRDALGPVQDCSSSSSSD